MLLVLTACLATSACTRRRRGSAEPLVTFAAHRDGGGFVVDRMRGTSGVLESPRRLSTTSTRPTTSSASTASRAPRSGSSALARARPGVGIHHRAPRGRAVGMGQGRDPSDALLPDRVIFQTDPFVSRDGRPPRAW
jgi:hypothetical protein